METRTLLERAFLYYPQQLHKQFKPSNQDTVGVFGNQQICSGNNETFIMGFGVGKGLVGGGTFPFFFFFPKDFVKMQDKKLGEGHRVGPTAKTQSALDLRCVSLPTWGIHTNAQTSIWKIRDPFSSSWPPVLLSQRYECPQLLKLGEEWVKLSKAKKAKQEKHLFSFCLTG